MKRKTQRAGWVAMTAVATGAGFASMAARAAVGYDTAGSSYTQDFDTLSNTGFANPWTNNSTLPG